VFSKRLTFTICQDAGTRNLVIKLPLYWSMWIGNQICHFAIFAWQLQSNICNTTGIVRYFWNQFHYIIVNQCYFRHLWLSIKIYGCKNNIFYIHTVVGDIVWYMHVFVSDLHFFPRVQTVVLCFVSANM